MRHNFFIAAIGVCVTLTTTPAFSANTYVKGALGYNALDNIEVTAPIDALVDFEGGYWVAGALGYQHGPYRVEAEISYTENDADTVTIFSNKTKYIEPVEGNINLLNTMLNGYYDFETNSPVRPYLGLGLGISNAEVEGYNKDYFIIFNEDTIVFAYQASVGLMIEISSCLGLDLGYRYFKTNDFSLSNKIEGVSYRFETDYVTNIFSVAVKYSF